MNSTQTGVTGSSPPVPPVLSESEAVVLGAAVRDPETLELVISELTQEDFYSARNQNVFRALREISEQCLNANPVSVAERSNCTRQDIEDLVSGASGVGGVNLTTLLADLRRVGSVRRVYEACSNACGQISRASRLEDIIDVIESGLYKANRDGSDEAASGSDVLQGVVKDFLERQKMGGGPEVSTGLRDLDRALVGLRPGKLGIIAARPSMGKTALASTIRRSVLAQGYGVIEFNLEMSKEELLERELSFQADINLTKVLRAKDISEDELARVNGLAFGGYPYQGRWWIDDRTYSVAGIRRKARILAGRMGRHGVKTGLVVVDYIQLAGEHGDGREQSVAGVSRGLKFLSKELGCTVLALSQLNRSCEYREDRRPIMSDLRESGAIEQDADWVGFVYREHMYDTSAPPEDTEFIIRKQRSGPIGTVRLSYSPKKVTFNDWEPRINTVPVESVN